MGLADVHAHLTHRDFATDLEAIVARARAAGLSAIVSNGLNPNDNRAVAALARRFDLVRPAFGFYPVDTVLPEMRAAGKADDFPREGDECSAEEGIAFVREHVGEAIAVGEIGLDGYWVPEEFWPRQEAVFRQLVEIALAADKPIIVHTRKREKRTFELLLELGAKRVNWHCFSGKLKLAREIAEFGHYVSIPANARRSQSFTRMLETLPRERLLLETDCPYLAPRAGGFSEPAHVAQTASFAAELWKTDAASVQTQLEENFARLFGV